MEAEGNGTNAPVIRAAGGRNPVPSRPGVRRPDHPERNPPASEVPTLTRDTRTTDVRPTPLSKRLLDVTVALIQLVLTAPLWVLIPLAIKLDDGGPVFFSQPRVGKGGRTFTSYKFRSMRSRREGNDQWRQAQLEEYRITRVGRVLRPMALDELPQLFNILRGDMSYVGPRALLAEEKEAASEGETVHLAALPGYDERHAVVPGLTGLAQVQAPRDLRHRHKFRYDLVYVRERTFWLDLRLILLSVWISLRAGWPDVGRVGD